MKIGTEEAIKRWDKYAEKFTESYDDQGDLHRKVLLNPALFELIGDVDGKKVLDAGCGEGYLSRIFSNANASVVAVDYSEKMLEIAQKKTAKELNITYHHGNCESLDFLADHQFDLIVSNMVIQDLANYEAAIHEMYRLLVHGGTFIFSISHPCFVTPNSGWVKNVEGEKLYWKVDHYFSEGPYEQIFPKNEKEKVYYFHRTLTSYMNAILNANFRLEGIVEPKPNKEMLKQYPSFKEDFRCSDFMIFKLRKL